MGAREVIEEHRAAGRMFTAAGVGSFVRERGEGDAVVCIHGVPASSFLYRKVIDELAQRGARGIAFDLPGLGLADRPERFDYSWTGLGRFSAAAVDALDLDRFHLVVHDIGGPVGFEVAAAMPDRIASLTVLNTVVDAASFRRPWTMRPFAVRGLGEMWLSSMVGPAFRQLMFMQGIKDRNAIRREELDAWLQLLKQPDGGKAFLRIMRSFECTPAKSALYAKVLRDVPYPVQIVWGRDDPALRLAHHGELARKAAGLETIHTVSAKHFLQEDQAPAVAQFIAEFVGSAR